MADPCDFCIATDCDFGQHTPDCPNYEICTDPCDELCEQIRHGGMTLEAATTLYDFAMLTDPTASNHAAHFLNAIRETYPNN